MTRSANTMTQIRLPNSSYSIIFEPRKDCLPTTYQKKKEREKGGRGSKGQGEGERDYKVCGATAHELTHKFITDFSSLDNLLQK